MKKLNESIIDIESLKSNVSDASDDLLSFIKKSGTNSKPKRKSLLDDIEQQIIVPQQLPEDEGVQEVAQKPLIPSIQLVQETEIAENLIPQQHQVTQFVSEPDIIIPQSIEQLKYQQKIQSIEISNKVQENRALLQLRRKKKESKNLEKALETPEVKQQKIQEKFLINQQLHQQFTEVTGEVLSPSIDLAEIKEQVEEALNDIPDAKEINLTDLDIKEISVKKDKTGYTKTLVSIKKSSFPAEMGRLATMVKKASNGVIRHRIMDMRTIGNTNKTQLRGESIKLTATSINFKPDSTALKVNKGTRFIISIPEDYDTTKNLIIYIQESRSKLITILEGNKFKNIDDIFEFLSGLISKYYTFGFDVTKKELLYKDANSPLLGVVKNVLASGEYKAKSKVDETGRVTSIIIVSKKVKNQWMGVSVREGKLTGTYLVHCISKVDEDWRFAINSKNGDPITISDLNGTKFINILNHLYDKDDWNIENEENRDVYLLNKLTYKKITEAFMIIYDEQDKHPDYDIIVKETLSQIDTAKSIADSYNAEGIIGKTKFLDFYILTFLAVQIIGGDKRHGKDYITTDEYHQKYSVSDRRAYEERSNILKKQKTDRNYNSRPFMFQLEYSINGKAHKYTNKDFSEILKNTGFLTDNPKAAK